MTALADAVAEVGRLEAIDADTGLGENGRANLEKARTAVESLKRQERRERAATRATVANKLSAHEACLDATYQALKDLVRARQELDRARAEAAAAERAARAAGVLDGTHGDHERSFFGTDSWRQLHIRVKELSGGKILG
ncbi:MAG: hypothetical protein ACXVRS_00645 [Gaiellaceae bacterium]